MSLTPNYDAMLASIEACYEAVCKHREELNRQLAQLPIEERIRFWVTLTDNAPVPMLKEIRQRNVEVSMALQLLAIHGWNFDDPDGHQHSDNPGIPQV